ncbi:MAG: type II secretion system protein GspD [Chlamydiia bacterium]|nr:type II secretion system protein GspD [Chlamydiia bacterium]
MKYIVVILLMATALQGQTIEEKKGGLYQTSGDLSPEEERVLLEVNEQLREKQGEIQQLNRRALELFNQGAPQEEYQSLLQEINRIKQYKIELEKRWRSVAVESTLSDNYALWHQPDTTIEQVVIDYGSSDFVYLMTPEIAGMKLSINSNLPIPRASWSELLELILSNSGVGVQQLNPFLRRLFLLKDNKSAIQHITNKREDLVPFPMNTRVCFLLTPDPTDVQRVTFFLESFVDPNQTVVKLAGRDILLVGVVGEILELLKLFDFITANRGDKEYHAVGLARVEAQEMAKVLGAVFDRAEVYQKGESRPQSGEGKQPRPSIIDAPIPIETNGLKVIVMEKISQAIFLVGTREEIREAKKVIYEVESQVGEAREKVIYRYVTKHSNPEELADILYRIYLLMVRTDTGAEEQPQPEQPSQQQEPRPTQIEAIPYRTQTFAIDPTSPFQAGYARGLPINPAPITGVQQTQTQVNVNRDNFLVDLKTGSIILVVERDLLPKLKDLMRKLDVPKKMVQLDVLFFEKRFRRQTDYGLNLLRIGDCASQTHSTCYRYTGDAIDEGLAGLFSFLISRKKSSWFPAYDLTYNFLLSQEDISLNSAPSVLTVNQTPAFIAIQEERSINTGVLQVNTTGATQLQDTFVRQQYGISIRITPTIHMATEDPTSDEPNSVTLESDIVFDTVLGGADPERPNVVRRNVNNVARVIDGQTVILGGLRTKTREDNKESIPFIGELPCLGKLFSTTDMEDTGAEMFIMITPKIILDPSEDLIQIRNKQLCLRPGDIPEFLCCLEWARERERLQIVRGWMTFLFGREPERCIAVDAEYDGCSCR